MAALPEGLVVEAAKYAGLSYVWGGESLSTGADCSGYVHAIFAQRGVSFPSRMTAEGQRQFCTPIPFDQVQPGDLIFVDHPDQRVEAAAADGYSATHVGISLGVGTKRVWSALDPDQGVKESIIANSDWWQSYLTPNAGRHPQVPATPLPTTPDRIFAIEELWPVVSYYAGLYGADPKVMIAIGLQESPDYETYTRIQNRWVHDDGHGRGFFGLDDRYVLIDFERWCGSRFASDGQPVGIVPPVLQIEFLADWLARMTTKYGDPVIAARVWHTGEGGYEQGLGGDYEALIRGHLARIG